MVLSLWVGVMAYRERRRWLLTWAGVYFTVAVTMTTLTYSKGPDPHDMFGCRHERAPHSGGVRLAHPGAGPCPSMRADRAQPPPFP